MKPTFALTLDEDSIGLLQRTPQGWLSLGSVAFGAPDMDEALAALRDKAEALAEGPLATKVVIPNDQILYDRVTASGPSRAARKAQIAAALAGRTPYALDDLVYDWAGEGQKVDVAAVATETLTEAETFAKTHGFNPVAFVAIPPAGQFSDLEPWFGATELVEALPFKDDLSLTAEAPITIFDPEAALPAEAPESEPEVPPAPEAPEVPEAPKSGRLSLKTQHLPSIPSYTEADDTSSFATKGNPFFDMLAARAQTRVETEDALAPAPIEALPDLHAAFADDEDALSIDMAVGSRSGNLLDFDDYDAAEPQFEPVDPAAQHIDLEDDKTEDTDFAEEELLEIPQAFWNSIDLANAPPEVRATEPQAFTPITPPVVEPQPEPVLETPIEVLPTEVAPLEAPEPVAEPVVTEPVVVEPITVADPSEPTEAPFNEDTLAEEVPSPLPTPALAQTPPVVVPPLPIPSRQVQPNRGEPRPAGKPAPSLGEPALHEGARRGVTPPRITPPMPHHVEAGVEVGKGSSLRTQPPVTVTEPLLAAGATLAPKAPIAVPTPAAALAKMRPATESETMKVFGMSPKAATKQVGGKPRYLGFILTAFLVVVLLAVALWAATLVDPSPTEVGLSEPPPGSQQLETAHGPEDQASVTSTEAFVSAQGPASAAPVVDATAPAEPQAAPQADTTAPNLPQGNAMLEAAPAVALTAPAVATIDATPSEAPTLQGHEGNVPSETAGRLEPTPEGVVTPEGITLFKGRPSAIPPQRPADWVSLAEPTLNAEAAASPSTQLLPIEGTASTVILPQGNSAFQPNDSAPKLRPKARPQGLSPAETAAAPQQQAAASGPVLDLVTRRPPPRPASLTAAAQAAAQQAPQVAAAAAAASAAASTFGQAASQQASLMPTARPAARPSLFAQPPQVATPRNAPQIRQIEPEEEDEPEITQTAAPRIPTQASVARQATVKDGLRLGQMNLIGVFGTSNNRVALVRDGSGRLSRVRVGDRLDGGQVTAISASELSYRKGRSDHRLQMPRS